jgi:uncharacterized membrane protein YqhA
VTEEIGSGEGPPDRPVTPGGTGGQRPVRKTQRRFESLLTASRLLAIIPVVFLLLDAAASFVYGTDIFVRTATDVLSEPAKIGGRLGIFLIVMDTFLVGATLMIAAFGFYELFVVRDDRTSDKFWLPTWLRSHDLDQLKARVVSMLILVAAITFVDRLVESQNEQQVLFLGTGISIVIAGLTAFLWFGKRKPAAVKLAGVSAGDGGPDNDGPDNDGPRGGAPGGGGPESEGPHGWAPRGGSPEASGHDGGPQAGAPRRGPDGGGRDSGSRRGGSPDGGALLCGLPGSSDRDVLHSGLHGRGAADLINLSTSWPRLARPIEETRPQVEETRLGVEETHRPHEETPHPVEAPRPVRVMAILAGTRRVGNWNVAHRTKVIAAAGWAQLDLREAVLPAQHVAVRVIAGLGVVTITVPPHMDVSEAGTTLLGFRSIHGGPSTQPRIAAPALLLSGACILGVIRVRRIP